MVPRGGGWRPASEADRIQSYLWLTLCWYVGAVIAFGLVWRVAQVMYDTVFGDDSRDRG